MKTIKDFTGYVRIENREEYNIFAQLLDIAGVVWNNQDKVVSEHILEGMKFPVTLNVWKDKTLTYLYDPEVKNWCRLSAFFLSDEFIVYVDNEQEFNDVQDYCMEFGSYNNGETIGFKDWKGKNFRNFTFHGDKSSFVFFSTKICGYSYKNCKPNWPLISYQEFKILSTLKTKSVEKKITGYKLVKTEYAEAALKIMNALAWSTIAREVTNITMIGKLKEAGVLDLWFEPIYEEEKAIITLASKQGVFNLYVSSRGIYYPVDDKYLTVEALRNIISARQVEDNGYTYYSKPTHVDLGCKKNVPVEDVRRVIKAYEKITEDYDI